MSPGSPSSIPFGRTDTQHPAASRKAVLPTVVFVGLPDGAGLDAATQSPMPGRRHAVHSGSEALRLAQQRHIDLWVVSDQLPDMRGVDLCQMLKLRSPDAAVFVTSDAYSAQVERAAYAARATGYGVQPAHLDWMDHWLAQRRQLKSRRGQPPNG
jgi:DNA-binding NarL/FixJ family response regulator